MLPMAPRRNNSSNNIVHQQQLHHLHPQHQQTQQQTPQLLLATAFYSDTDNNNQLEAPTSAVTNINHIITTSNNNNIATTMSPMQTSNSSSVNGNNNNSNNSNNNHNCVAQQQQFMHCCFPNGDCLKLDTLIALDDVSGCVRVLCNNENCNVGQYMHRECFESWEQTVLVTLKSIGRARSWSDRQRSQNLWTKKGYDLVYKACGCKCGRGHIRKDLEWSAPPALATTQLVKNVGNAMNGNFNGVVVLGGGNNSANSQRIANGILGNDDAEASKKKKKRNRNNQKPTLALTPLNPSGYHPNSQQQQQQQQQQQHQHQHQQAAQNANNSANVAASNGSISSSNANNATAANNHNNIANSSINLLPNPNVGVIGSGLHNHNQQHQQHYQQLQQQQDQHNATSAMSNNDVANGQVGGNVLGLDLNARAGSLSSSGSSSPSASQTSDQSISPIHHHQQQHHQQQQQQQQQLLQLQQQYQQSLLQNGLSKSILNGINGCLAAGGNNGPQLLTANKAQQQQQQQQQSAAIVANGIQNLSCIDQQQLVQQQKNKEVEIYSERVRSTSGCNGIFSRRLDFSSFNLLPKTRLNSYQVKIEDEGNHGNDETRLFILSSLAQSQMSRVACILCEEPMLVFDRYPLVDGSFFLSPKQHSTGCIEVKYEGRALYLTCVCMGCLDGTATNRVINCRFCGEIWDGSNLVLGTMYAYDIFAAMPCCAERLKCNNCFKLLLHPQQRLNFYSDYSHCVTCPYCATQDTHFVKPLSYCYNKSAVARHQLIA